MTKLAYEIHGNYACFYHGPFSQWHPTLFTLDGIRFTCAEQAMMHGKAVLFGDTETARKILAAATPAEQKRLGRQVRGFDPDVWERENIMLVTRINEAKFGQDPRLLELLLSTKNLFLAECSPTDTIWGIGRGLDWPHLDDPTTWRGENRLGLALWNAKLTLSRGMVFGNPADEEEYENVPESCDPGVIPAQGQPERFAIAATGHRPNKLYGYDLKDPRWMELGRCMRRFLIDAEKEHGALRCISGMALGVDQLFALVALKLRDEGHDILVTCALPCQGQNSRWVSDEYWQDIMKRADEKIYVHDGPYTPACMQERNEWMVDHADLVLAVWDGTSGGTANCVRYAEKAGVAMENIHPEAPAREPAQEILPGFG